jgi:hypothetical protein
MSDTFDGFDTSDTPDTSCTRCDGALIFAGDKDFHEGSTGWGFFLGDLGELFTNREKVEMYICESCGHIEFFAPA